MDSPKHILILRFSALGDIAMTVPVIKNVLQQNPQLQITYVSVPFVKPLFEGIERLHFYAVNLKETKGVFDLIKVASTLKKNISFDAVADLHDVLRTKIIRFFIGSKNTAIIDKGRKERHELTRPSNKMLRPIKPMFERYADVFRSLDIDVKLNVENGIVKQNANKSLLPSSLENKIFIGIAPFAKHAAKLYPLQKMREVIPLLANNPRNEILIFGTKAETTGFIDSMLNLPNVKSMGGGYNLAEELNLISQLDVMVSMDSANMHLASLVGTPVISIWGGTHPFAGFYGWGQADSNIIQTDLPCRPSSIFGNKNCPLHGDAGCMQAITPEMIVEKITSLVARK